jgi:hypothetical protein
MSRTRKCQTDGCASIVVACRSVFCGACRMKRRRELDAVYRAKWGRGDEVTREKRESVDVLLAARDAEKQRTRWRADR